LVPAWPPRRGGSPREALAITVLITFVERTLWIFGLRCHVHMRVPPCRTTVAPQGVRQHRLTERRRIVGWRTARTPRSATGGHCAYAIPARQLIDSRTRLAGILRFRCKTHVGPAPCGPHGTVLVRYHDFTKSPATPRRCDCPPGHGSRPPRCELEIGTRAKASRRNSLSYRT